ncbi:MAG TPA: hypothetical protein VMU06_13700 [Stellaceae bacterium]|nr:hypothetical protein [Stellaceae bacterium]
MTTASNRCRASLIGLLALAAALLAPSASSAEEAPATRPGVVVLDARTATATVLDIDYQTRMTTLQRADGKTITLRVDDRFPNLDHVHKGDTVKFVYFESTAIMVQDPKDTVSITSSETVQVARRGHKPEGTIVRTERVVATVTKIDYTKRSVTVQGPEGRKVILHAGPEVKRFNEIKKGDQIAIEMTETLAVSVTR